MIDINHALDVYREEEEKALMSLERLVNIAKRLDVTSGTRPIKDFIAALYNDDFAPSIPSLCCRITDSEFEDVIRVMRLRRRTYREPHMYFKNGSELFGDFVIKNCRRHRAPGRRSRF